MAHGGIVRRKLFCALILTGLVGCSSVNSALEPGRVDYKSAAKTSTPNLEVPPDLTQLQRDNRYAVPEANNGTAMASSYNLQQRAHPITERSTVALNAAQDIRIERVGNQRWLVVKQTPETLWPKVKDFWQEAGFVVNVALPETGVMETDWAENRAKIPQDIIRNTLGKVFDSLYSTGERDKFRTRLERSMDGATEIYISHRGAQEVVTGQQKDGTIWTARPSDPELEAEFLSRLMVRLTAMDASQAKVGVTNAAPQQVRAKLVKNSDGSRVEIDEGFDRVWRRVGLALDRVGFTVEDRDRLQGLYFVRYVDQDKDAQNKGEKGFLSRLFSGADDKTKTAQHYRISVKAARASGAASTADSMTQVTVQGNNGHPETSQTAEKILSLLNDQLK